MKTNIFYLAVPLLIILLLSCSQPPSNNNMAFDTVDFIQDFPKSVTLQNSMMVDIDVIGIRNFAIYDSMLIFSTINDGALWSFVSLNDYSVLGNFLSKGQGPFQFLESPSVATKATFIKQDSLFAYVYDSQKGKLLKMNVDKSLEQNELNIFSVDDSLPTFLFNLVIVDTATFLCKEVNPNLTQQIRYLKHDNMKETPKVLERLNDANIDEGEDINILSSITKRHEKSGRIVEMPIGLNHVNIYSLDGSFRKTISVADKLDNIDNIQEKKRFSRNYTFADLRLFEGFFGVLHINEAEVIYQTNRQKKPTIMLFDYSGSPLMEIKLDQHITSFDIDFEKGELYTFDVHSDGFYKYDIGDSVLKEI